MKINYKLTDEGGTFGMGSLKKAIEFARSTGRMTEIQPQTGRAEQTIYNQFGCDWVVIIGPVTMKKYTPEVDYSYLLA